MVERLWKDYRRLEADLRDDLSSQIDFGPQSF
jgi:hypothetical protein